MIGSKRQEVAGDWKKLYNEKLHNLYSSSNIIRVIKLRMMKWAGHAACMGEMRNAYKILVRKHEGRRQFGRSMCI
jgi:hypothetical protein